MAIGHAGIPESPPDLLGGLLDAGPPVAPEVGTKDTPKQTVRPLQHCRRPDRDVQPVGTRPSAVALRLTEPGPVTSGPAQAADRCSERRRPAAAQRGPSDGSVLRRGRRQENTGVEEATAKIDGFPEDAGYSRGQLLVPVAGRTTPPPPPSGEDGTQSDLVEAPCAAACWRRGRRPSAGSAAK